MKKTIVTIYCDSCGDSIVDDQGRQTSAVSWNNCSAFGYPGRGVHIRGTTADKDDPHLGGTFVPVVKSIRNGCLSDDMLALCPACMKKFLEDCLEQVRGLMADA